MIKANLDKITQRSIHIHTYKKRKRKKIFLIKKYRKIEKLKIIKFKKRKRATKPINKSTNDNKH